MEMTPARENYLARGTTVTSVVAIFAAGDVD